MRITIIPSENKISIDGESLEGCDVVSWIPEFVGDITGVSQKVHAVQWYDDHGEIELVTRDNNIPITELGIFEKAITIHAEKKLAIEAEAEAEAKAKFDQDQSLIFDLDFDIDALLAELESEENVNVGAATT